MDIGREGGGPGEFRCITALGIDPVRAHVLVKESNGTVHRISTAGEYVSRCDTRFFYSMFGDEGVGVGMTSIRARCVRLFLGCKMFRRETSHG